MTTYHPDTSETAEEATGRNGADTHKWTDAARNEMKARTEQARDAAEATQQKMRDTAQRGSDNTAQFVRENPAIALAGAVGVGILLGLALRGRD